MALDRTKLSNMCNAPPSPTETKLPVTVLKIHLHKEPRPHMRELMNHVFLSKYHRNENILIQGPPPQPHPSPASLAALRSRTTTFVIFPGLGPQGGQNPAEVPGGPLAS